METLKNIVDNVTESVATDVQSIVDAQDEKKSVGLNPQQWIAMSRKERRSFLKRNTKYFQEKSKKDFNTRFDVISKNIEFGNMKSKVVTENDIRVNTEILENGEKIHRRLLEEQGYDKEYIEKYIDSWYSKIIKDGSFMIEK